MIIVWKTCDDGTMRLDATSFITWMNYYVRFVPAQGKWLACYSATEEDHWFDDEATAKAFVESQYILREVL
jgi:hypothetical protein